MRRPAAWLALALGLALHFGGLSLDGPHPEWADQLAGVVYVVGGCILMFGGEK